jgi:hypothetical protein
MIEMLDDLFSHRMQFLNKYFTPKAIPTYPQNPYFDTPTTKEISTYLSGQLNLFPRGSGFTNLKWNRDKIEFIELFICVYESNAVVRTDNKSVTKKDYMEFLMWTFNIPISHWHGSLSYGKDRKIKRESEFLKELVEEYNKLV